MARTLFPALLLATAGFFLPSQRVAAQTVKQENARQAAKPAMQADTIYANNTREQTVVLYTTNKTDSLPTHCLSLIDKRFGSQISLTMQGDKDSATLVGKVLPQPGAETKDIVFSDKMARGRLSEFMKTMAGYAGRQGALPIIGYLWMETIASIASYSLGDLEEFVREEYQQPKNQ
jgi:hypothetical protein